MATGAVEVERESLGVLHEASHLPFSASTPHTEVCTCICSSSVGERFREFLRSWNVVSAAPLTSSARSKKYRYMYDARLHVHVHVQYYVCMCLSLRLSLSPSSAGWGGAAVEWETVVPEMQHHIQLRSKVAMAMRATLIKHGSYMHRCVQHYM